MRSDDLVVTRHGARFLGRHFPCSVGRGGIVAAAAKREGDWATPAGTHGVIGCLWRPDRLARPVEWAVPIGPGDLWSDDPKDPDYNLMVRIPHRYRHERLRRADPQYDLLLLTDWNWPNAERSRGSAIFVHIWRRPGFPTAGCVAFAQPDLLWIVQRLRHRSRLVVQG